MHAKLERLLSKSLTTLEVMAYYLVVHTGPDGPNGAQNGNPGEGTDPEDDQAEGGRLMIIVQKEGSTWSRTELDRYQWRSLMEGYILQWMDKD